MNVLFNEDVLKLLVKNDVKISFFCSLPFTLTMRLEMTRKSIGYQKNVMLDESQMSDYRYPDLLIEIEIDKFIREVCSA